MRHHRNLTAWLTALVITLFCVSHASAFPPLPSSFYGTVKQDGENIPDGTLVEALIDGIVMATFLSETYQGNSVYSLDIPGDDATTAKIEGGTSGEMIQFRVGGVLADQTAVWASGVNQNLDLTLAAEKALAPTLPTFTPVPSQTPIPQATATCALTQTPTQEPKKEENEPKEDRQGLAANPTPTATGTPTPTETQAKEETQFDGSLKPKNAISDNANKAQDTNFVAEAVIDEQDSASKIPKEPEEAPQPAPTQDKASLWIAPSASLVGVLVGYWVLRRKKQRRSNPPLI
jgi:hypothetical protein